MYIKSNIKNYILKTIFMLCWCNANQICPWFKKMWANQICPWSKKMWEYRTHVKNVSPWIVMALAAIGLLGSHIYQSWSSFNDVNSTEATFQKLIGTPNRRNDPNSRKKKRQNI